MRSRVLKTLALLPVPALIAVAGCGGRVSAGNLNPAASVSIHASAARIDTSGSTRFSATLADGEAARVVWSVTGGDPKAGAGSITTDGLYTPPGYLTRESATVSVNAVLTDQAGEAPADTALLTVTPGFIQPLTPGNVALGANGTATISGSMTEVGGTGSIHFTLASDAAGTPRGAGSLSEPKCVRGSVEESNPAYTVCSVTYTAPAVVPASGSVFIVGSVASNPLVSWTRVLLNSTGISSNPVTHQARLAVPVALGSSSGNNSDYDASQGQLSDCCGGTLGSLLEDKSGTQYVLSNNHVLARSDQSLPGETIIQPGLIDNGCTPYGVGPGTTPVATLTGYPGLSSGAGNVDAAIARVSPGAVDSKGDILELGARQLDGTLAAAPPGISSSSGKGKAAALGMMVAKSGRTTGLTCAAVSAVSVDVVVDYFTDCAETTHSFSKTFTNQIAIAGAGFSDAGDSGALVVDTTDAEPVGLFFAGGTDVNGVEHAIANPAGDVLAALDAQVPGPNGAATAYSFVGAADHAVSCLSYGAVGKTGEDLTGSTSAGLASLGPAEQERAEAALPAAQSLLTSAGIARVGLTVSKDHPGEGAVAVYLEPGVKEGSLPAIPASIGGVATVVTPAAVQAGDSSASAPATVQPRAASFTLALAAKQRHAAELLRLNPALFGVGVGQSADNPAEAAVILYVDRRKSSGTLPESLDGQRVRAVFMDRFHVTRSHGSPARSASACPGARRVPNDEGLPVAGADEALPALPILPPRE